ncbi:endolytic transglycosylase MltG [Candidatus Nomurabacteria bacterium]|nr:endolytic transglycosylase MltG [Candidatus Nomurabacteria bacterium]
MGADPTFKYAAAQFSDINSPDSNSPYNTRKVVGLPPTAIANFNISALEAVANPASSDFIYFVHGDDGKAYFSKTLQEHEQNTAKYCTVACR